MKPLIVDPHDYNRFIAWQQALDWCDFFLKVNNISRPKAIYHSVHTHGCYGVYWYKTQKIAVNILLCKPPVKVPVRSYTFTGYKADLTVAGVLAHELGHHVWRHALTPKQRTAWRKHVPGTPAVSGYEPNIEEAFAETTKLFVLNPKLLEEGRTLRHELFMHFGLKPATDAPWTEILQHAHPKLIAAAHNWIDKDR